MHDEREMEALKAAAACGGEAAKTLPRLGVWQAAGAAGPLPIRSSRIGHVLDALERGYQMLGREDPATWNDVLRYLVLELCCVDGWGRGAEVQ